MDPKTAIGAAGSFFSLNPPLDKVQAYLEQVEETREVKARLAIVLHSIRGYKESIKAASDVSGATLRSTVDNLVVPVKVAQIEGLLRAMMKFNDDFASVIGGVLGFGKTSNELVLYEQSFMQKVQRTLPEVYDIILHFGNHYDPRTGSLDLSHLPTFFAIHVAEVSVPEDEARKENEDGSKLIAEGEVLVDKAIKAARSIGQQNLKIKDRRLQREFPRSWNGLFKKIDKLKCTSEVALELSKNAPPWMLGFAKIMEKVQGWLDEQSKAVYRSPSYKSTAHRKRA